MLPILRAMECLSNMISHLQVNRQDVARVAAALGVVGVVVDWAYEGVADGRGLRRCQIANVTAGQK